ncbi:MAG: 4'-phosphopantetheinyl transferase superfamily protein [Planctomycetia bacterium]
MMGWPPGRALPIGRICRLSIGGCPVEAVFDVPHGRGESLSGVAVRLAEELAGAAIGAAAGAVRVAAALPSGRPMVLVDGETSGLALSISHTPGLYGAAVSQAGAVGLDIVDPADAGRPLDVFFTPDELAFLPDDYGLLRAMLWAAKEAAYKAARFDTEFRPRQVMIESLSPNGFTWCMRDRYVEARGEGGLATVGRHMVALAAAVPGRGDSPASGASADMREAVSCS